MMQSCDLLFTCDSRLQRKSSRQVLTQVYGRHHLAPCFQVTVADWIAKSEREVLLEIPTMKLDTGPKRNQEPALRCQAAMVLWVSPFSH